jgi:hypothetical protein
LFVFDHVSSARTRVKRNKTENSSRMITNGKLEELRGGGMANRHCHDGSNRDSDGAPQPSLERPPIEAMMSSQDDPGETETRGKDRLHSLVDSNRTSLKGAPKMYMTSCVPTFVTGCPTVDLEENATNFFFASHRAGANNPPGGGAARIDGWVMNVIQGAGDNPLGRSLASCSGGSGGSTHAHHHSSTESAATPWVAESGAPFVLSSDESICSLFLNQQGYDSVGHQKQRDISLPQGDSFGAEEEFCEVVAGEDTFRKPNDILSRILARTRERCRRKSTSSCRRGAISSSSPTCSAKSSFLKLLTRKCKTATPDHQVLVDTKVLISVISSPPEPSSRTVSTTSTSQAGSATPPSSQSPANRHSSSIPRDVQDANSSSNHIILPQPLVYSPSPRKHREALSSVKDAGATAATPFETSRSTVMDDAMAAHPADRKTTNTMKRGRSLVGWLKSRQRDGGENSGSSNGKDHNPVTEGFRLGGGALDSRNTIIDESSAWNPDLVRISVCTKGFS